MLAFAQVVASPPSVLPPADDIVVIGRRLNGWRGKISTNPFGTSCRTTQSTGDGEIDRIGCTAMERCWPDALPRMRAAHAKGVAEADRTRMESEASTAFAACLKTQRDALIERLGAQRAAARGAGS